MQTRSPVVARSSSNKRARCFGSTYDHRSRQHRMGSSDHRRAHDPRACRPRQSSPVEKHRAPCLRCDVQKDQPAHRDHRTREHRHPGHPAQPMLLSAPSGGFSRQRRLGDRPLGGNRRLASDHSSPMPASSTRPVQVLLLRKHAVDLARAPAQQERHATTAAGIATTATTSQATRAAGSQGGETPGFRPLARGWESPCARPSDRAPASRGTRL